MSNSDISIDDPFVARLVRLENRISVVLASFAADLAHLRHEIKQSQAQLATNLHDATAQDRQTLELHVDQKLTEQTLHLDRLSSLLSNVAATTLGLEPSYSAMDTKLGEHAQSLQRIGAVVAKIEAETTNIPALVASAVDHIVTERAAKVDQLCALVDDLNNTNKFIPTHISTLIDSLEERVREDKVAHLSELKSHQSLIASLDGNLADIVPALTMTLAELDQKLFARLQRLDEFERLENLLNEAASIAVERANKADADGVALSMQLQTTEQRTLSGLLQVQTDSANRTNELKQQTEAVLKLISALENQSENQTRAINAHLDARFAKQTDALHRQIIASDQSETVHSINTKVADVLAQVSYLQQQQAAMSQDFDDKLMAQKASILEVIQTMLEETPLKLFKFRTSK
jgi:hypothetical protein